MNKRLKRALGIGAGIAGGAALLYPSIKQFVDIAQRSSGVRQVPVKIFGSYKKGGVVKKTGPALLHKGEIVLPPKMSARIRRMAAKRR
jgi:hypothetical protein